MKPSATRRPFTLGIAVVVASTLVGAACLGVSTRSRAEAEITGPDGTPVRVITSTRFTRQRGASSGLGPDTAGIDVRLLDADTSGHSLPTSVARELTDTQRIFVKVALSDSAADEGEGPVEAELQLLVDGDQQAQAAGNLRDGPLSVSFTSFVAR